MDVPMMVYRQNVAIMSNVDKLCAALQNESLHKNYITNMLMDRCIFAGADNGESTKILVDSQPALKQKKKFGTILVLYGPVPPVRIGTISFA